MFILEIRFIKHSIESFFFAIDERLPFFYENHLLVLALESKRLGLRCLAV